MRSYRKWVLSLGLAALLPGMVMAGPALPWSKKTEQTQSNDQQIAEQVASELRSAKLSHFDIEVEVVDGVCTLAGKIDDNAQKQAAARAAQRVKGVRSVNNRLVANSSNPIQKVSGEAGQGGATNAAFFTGSKPKSGGASDQQTAERIASAIKSSGIHGHEIDLKFANGVAVLDGRAADPRTISQLTQVVSRVPGVQQVENRLTAPGMRPAPAPTTPNQAIAERIAGALGQAGLGSNDIEVRFNNGVASLRGVVGSPQHAAMAEQIVTRVPGVQEINNELQVVARSPIQQVNYQEGGPGPGGMPPGGMPMGPGMQPGMMPPGGGMPPGMMGPGGMPGGMMHGGRGPSHMAYDMPNLPPHAWPSYANYPNYAAVTYPTQYSASAWPYIGPFYPYPQVPLGWRKVQLEWDDGAWSLNFNPRTDKWFWFLQPSNWE